MKIIVSIALLCSLLIAQSSEDNFSKYEYKKPIVAVFKFKSSGSRTTSTAVELQQICASQLSKLDRFTIREIDSESIESYNKEVQLQASGLTKTEEIQIGNIRGYTKGITGNLSSINTSISDGLYTTTLSVMVAVLDMNTMTKESKQFNSKGYGSSYDSSLSEALNKFTKEILFQYKIWFPIDTIIPETSGLKSTLYIGKNVGLYKGMRFGTYNIVTNRRVDGKKSVNYRQVGELKITKILSEEESVGSWVRGNKPKAEQYIREIPRKDFSVSPIFSYSFMRMTFNDWSKIFYDSTSKNDFGPSFGVAFEKGSGLLRYGADIICNIGINDFYVFEERLKGSINFDVIGEYVQLEFSPFFGVAQGIASLDLPSDITTDEYTMMSVTLGGGIMGKIKFSPINRFNISLNTGYKGYLPIEGRSGRPFRKWALYNSTQEEWLYDIEWLPVPAIILSGLEFGISIDINF